MEDKHEIDPATALDRMFALIRSEAVANPAFGRRLLEALGHTVIYRGEDAIAAVDPVLVAMRGLEEFRKTFLSLKPADLKRIGESSGLFAKKEKLPKSAGELVDVMWERAQQRIRDLVPNHRQAAE